MKIGNCHYGFLQQSIGSDSEKAPIERGCEFV